MEIFAREKEQFDIEERLNSDRAELVAVYGRRRVGKTFLVNQSLRKNRSAIFFSLTGLINEDSQKPVSEATFLSSFTAAWLSHINETRIFRDFNDCILALVELGKSTSKTKPLYIFLDELPWLAKSSPDFYATFVGVWNNDFSHKPWIKVFLAGSATSWMMENLVQAKGGMAKRLTHRIALRPFNLKETFQFLKHSRVDISHNDLFLIYNTIGGIPYYLQEIKKSLSPLENLYQLIGDHSGRLYFKEEYSQLFRYLFADFKRYQQVVDFIAEKPYGRNLEEISRSFSGSKKPTGTLNRMLQDLEYSDILCQRVTWPNKTRGRYYFVADEYIRFVSRWLQNRRSVQYGDFIKIFQSAAYTSRQGFDFEITLFKNSNLISEQLGISGIGVEPFIFYRDRGVQIDLLLVRSDNTITICEAKSYDQPYKLSQDDVALVHNRIAAIKDKCPKKYYVNYCYLARNGVVKGNKYYNEISPLVIDFSKVF